MRCSYSTLVKAKRAGRATSVRVSPTGTAVTEYQVPLGNRYSLKEAGVIGLPSWSDRATQTETWVRVPRLSATCPRRVVAFDGGRSDIDRTMEFGDEFEGATLNAATWTVEKGAAQTVAVSGGVLDVYTATAYEGYASAYSIRTFGTGTAVRSRAKTAHWGSAGYYEYLGYSRGSPPGNLIVMLSGTGVNAQCLRNYDNGAFGYAAVSGWSANTWGTIEVRRDAAQSSAQINTASFGPLSTAYITNAASLIVSTATAGAEVWTDWVLVRKYVANEPIAGTAQPTATNRALSRRMRKADLIRACCT